MDLILNKNDLKKLKKLGEGVYGKCYKTKDGKVLKIFFQEVNSLYDNIKGLSQIKSDYFIFPNDLLYNGEVSPNTLVGYYMKYIEGDYFNCISDKVKMVDFISALWKVENEIRRISERKIQIYDLKGDNVLYTPDNEIKIIDTDLYVFNNNANSDNIRVGNIQELSYLISESFIKENEHKFKSSRLIKLLDDYYYGYINPSYFIYEIMEDIRKTTKEDVRDYNDFKNGLKLIMKKH